MYKILLLLVLVSCQCVDGQTDVCTKTIYENDHGVDLADNGKYKEALELFTKGIKRNPNCSILYYNRGYTTRELGDNRGALKDLSKAIELNPNYIDAINERSLLKGDLEDWRGALSDINKVITLFKQKDITIDGEITLPGLIFNRGICKINIGDVNNGCLDLSKAGEDGYFEAYESIKLFCN